MLQEHLLAVMRRQVAEDGQAVQQLAELQNTVQVLEHTLADQRHTATQLRTAAAVSQQEQQATVQGLLAELADKSDQLVDAERRFSQLESLMQRIATRTGQGTGVAQAAGGKSEADGACQHHAAAIGQGNTMALQQQRQQQHMAGGGAALGLTAKLQRWQQQGLADCYREQQQQGDGVVGVDGVRAAAGVAVGLPAMCGRCGVRGCDGGILCAAFRGSPSKTL